MIWLKSLWNIDTHDCTVLALNCPGITSNCPNNIPILSSRWSQTIPTLSQLHLPFRHCPLYTHALSSFHIVFKLSFYPTWTLQFLPPFQDASVLAERKAAHCRSRFFFAIIAVRRSAQWWMVECLDRTYWPDEWLSTLTGVVDLLWHYRLTKRMLVRKKDS